MIKKLTLSEIQETCNYLLYPEIKNLDVLNSLNSVQIKQVYNYANNEGIRLMSIINDALGQPGTSLTYDDLHRSLNVGQYEKIIQAIENYKQDLLNLKADEIKEKGEKLRLKYSQHNSTGTTITKFNDILEEKYKGFEKELFALLGTFFPEFYNSEGRALNNKHNIKAILNTWFKSLKAENVISINPTTTQKEQICKILLDKCQFSDRKLTPKTFFSNAGIEGNSDFNKNLIELKKEIKKLKTS